MKIAFVHTKKEFNKAFFTELKSRLTEHELTGWDAAGQAPANDFDIAIVMGKFTQEQMASQTKLRLIQTASAGYDGIDVDTAAQKGILVGYAPSGATGNAISVAEFAVLLILGASRSLNQVIQPQPTNRSDAPGISIALYGKTVCIVGLGEIGRLLAKRLQPFGVKLLATDDHPKDVPAGVKVYSTDQMKEAFAGADYVVLCVRATAKNENLIDAAALKAMKQGAILINVARGSLVDETALLEALKSGHLTYAGLDVVKNEPVKPDDPLLGRPNTIIAPHVAGTTDLTLKGMLDYVTRVVNDFAKGKKPDALVDTSRTHDS